MLANRSAGVSIKRMNDLRLYTGATFADKVNERLLVLHLAKRLDEADAEALLTCSWPLMQP